MNSIPENDDGARKQRDSDGVVEAFTAIVVLCVLIYGMYYACNFVVPSGQSMSIGSFIAIFFREIAFVGFLALALVVACFAWLVVSTRKLFRRGGDAF